MLLNLRHTLGLLNPYVLKNANAIDPEWLKAIKSPTLGFTHKTPKEILATSILAALNLMTMTLSNSSQSAIFLGMSPKILVHNVPGMTKSKKQLACKDITVQSLIPLVLQKLVSKQLAHMGCFKQF
jgi:hypothetical protein